MTRKLFRNQKVKKVLPGGSIPVSRLTVEVLRQGPALELKVVLVGDVPMMSCSSPRRPLVGRASTSHSEVRGLPGSVLAAGNHTGKISS